LQLGGRVGLEKRPLGGRGGPQEDEELVAAARSVGETTARVDGGQGAQRRRTGDVRRQELLVVLDRRSLVLGVVAVERGQGLAGRELVGGQRHHLFEGRHRAARVARAQQLTPALPQARPAGARRGLVR